MLASIVGTGEDREIHLAIPFPESLVLDPEQEYITIQRLGGRGAELVASVNSKGQTSPLRAKVDGERVILMGGANVWFRNPIHVKESPEAKAAKALAAKLKEQAEAQERAKYVTLQFDLLDKRSNLVAKKGTKLLADDVNSALLSGEMRFDTPRLGGNHAVMTAEQENAAIESAIDTELLAHGIDPETV